MTWAIALFPLVFSGQGSTQPATYSLDWRPKAGQILEYKVRLESPLNLDESVTFEARLRVRVATSYGSNHSEVLDFTSVKAKRADEEEDLEDIRNFWIHPGPLVHQDRAGQFAWVLGTFADRSLATKEVKVGSHWTVDEDDSQTAYDALALESIAGKKALKIAFDSRTKDKKLIHRGTIWISASDGAPLKASYDFPAIVTSDQESNSALVLCTLECIGESREVSRPTSAPALKAYRALSDFLVKSEKTYTAEERNLKNYEAQFEEDDVTLVVKLVPKKKGLNTITGVFDREKLDLKAILTED